MEASEEHPQKAHSPILVTLFGIMIEVSEVQFPKAFSPILVTLLGITTSVNEEHLLNTSISISVKVSGNNKVCKLLVLNAYAYGNLLTFVLDKSKYFKLGKLLTV